MAHDSYQVSLKAIIIRPDGKMLGLNGKKGGAFEGYYDMPGGRIDVEEFGVPFETIIRREIEEETGGLDVELEQHPIAIGRHQSKQGYRVLYVFFIGRLSENVETVTISDEHEGFAWLEVDETNLEKYFVSGMLEGMKQYVRGNPQAEP